MGQLVVSILSCKLPHCCSSFNLQLQMNISFASENLLKIQMLKNVNAGAVKIFIQHKAKSGLFVLHLYGAHHSTFSDRELLWPNNP